MRLSPAKVARKYATDHSHHSLILLLVGALPIWPYSAGLGSYPGGGLGVILIIVIILVLMGRI
jgi:Protein of unknown function (DUF3309)